MDEPLWAALEKERLTYGREYPEAKARFAEAIRACLMHGLSMNQRRRDFVRRRAT